MCGANLTRPSQSDWRSFHSATSAGDHPIIYLLILSSNTLIVSKQECKIMLKNYRGDACRLKTAVYSRSPGDVCTSLCCILKATSPSPCMYTVVKELIYSKNDHSPLKSEHTWSYGNPLPMGLPCGVSTDGTVHDTVRAVR